MVAWPHHDGSELVVEVCGDWEHLAFLVVAQVDDLVLVDDAPDWLHVALAGAPEELLETALPRCSHHLLH